MSGRAVRSLPAFLPEALAASQVGTWEADFRNNRVAGDEITAALFGLDPHEVETGVPLAVFARAIHSEDRPVFTAKINQMRVQGGLYVIEYRTCPMPGVVRWLLARGRFEHDADFGDMRGRGICIDVTDSKALGRDEDRAFYLCEPSAGTGDPMDQAADHALAARGAIDRIDGSEKFVLRKAADALLWAIGRALARRA